MSHKRICCLHGRKCEIGQRSKREGRRKKEKATTSESSVEPDSTLYMRKEPEKRSLWSLNIPSDLEKNEEETSKETMKSPSQNDEKESLAPQREEYPYETNCKGQTSKKSAFYLGAMEPSEAEKQCRQKRTFRFYHCVSVPREEIRFVYNKLPSTLLLCMVYRSSDGKHRTIHEWLTIFFDEEQILVSAVTGSQVAFGLQRAVVRVCRFKEMANRPQASNNTLSVKSVAECYLTAGHCLLKLHNLMVQIKDEDPAKCGPELKQLEAAVRTLCKDIDGIARSQDQRVRKLIEKDIRSIEEKEEARQEQLADANLTAMEDLINYAETFGCAVGTLQESSSLAHVPQEASSSRRTRSERLSESAISLPADLLCDIHRFLDERDM
uniref:Protein-serine/threonine phosphatase n=1 Tax=Steinernema glaseri TaxID=37863 RepID=A0A1I7Z0Y3_9BILA